MNKNLYTPIIIFLIFILLSIWSIPKILGGNFIPIFLFTCVAGIFYLTKLKPIWIGLILGMLNMSFTIPFSILQRITIGSIIIVVIVTLSFIEGVIEKKILPSSIFRNLEVKLMAFVGFVIVIRFLYDRPFSDVLGGRGGGQQAIFFLFGAIAYFIMIKITLKEWDFERNFRILIILLCLSFFYNLTQRLYAFGSSDFFYPVIMGLFDGTLWFLCPLILAYFMYNKEKNSSRKYNLKQNSTISATLLLGAVTPFRSRIYFAAACILFVSLCFNKIKKSILLMLLVTSILSFMLLTFFDLSKIPDPIIRSMSTIIPINASYQVNSEVGWNSDFRLSLLEYAWDEIQKSPITGLGFYLPSGDIKVVPENRQTIELVFESLVLSKTYHNSFLQLAAYCGIPCTLAFLIALIINIKNVLFYLRRTEHNRIHMFLTGIFSFFIVSIMQSIINGSGENFFTICILMGTMRGSLIRKNTATDIR